MAQGGVELLMQIAVVDRDYKNHRVRLRALPQPFPRAFDTDDGGIQVGHPGYIHEHVCKALTNLADSNGDNQARLYA